MMDRTKPAQHAEELATLLASPVPRRVPPRIAAAAKRQAAPPLLLWLGLIMGVMGMGIVPVIFPWGFWHDWQLAVGDTRSAEGTIVAAEMRGMKINRRNVWKFRFEYTVPEGTAVRRGDCFATGQKWRSGDRVQVRYLAGENLACPEGARTTAAGGLAAFVAFTPFIGFTLFALVVRARRQAVTTLERGQLTEAKIVSVGATWMRAGLIQFYKVTLKAAPSESRVRFAARLYEKSGVSCARERLQSNQSVYMVYESNHPGRAVLPEVL